MQSEHIDPELLAKQLAELAKFPEMNPGPVLRVDRSSTILLANKAARALFPALTLVGQQWRELCPGMDNGLWEAIIRASEPPQIEAEFDGRCFSFVHVRPEGLEQAFIYGTDITARRRAEKLLAEQARFPEMNPGPVLLLMYQGSIVLANAAAREVFGERIVGSNWCTTCPGMDGAMWERILKATGIVNVEARVGAREFVFAHRRDVESELVFVYGADVTAQKTAERALRQTEKMATLGTLAAGVCPPS